MKRAKGKELNAANLNPDDFSEPKYEHMMGSSGLIGFCRFLRVGSGRPPRTTRAVLGR